MQKERFAYLDTARISLMVLGVFFHAATMFSINDDSFVKFDTREKIIGQLAGVAHIFRMEAFFILAAFLSSAMLERYGSKSFFEKRSLRLLPPFITGLFIQHISSLVLHGQPLIEDYPAIQYLWFLPALYAIALLQQRFLTPQKVDRLLPPSIRLTPWIAVPIFTAISAFLCFAVESILKAAGIEWLTKLTAGVISGSQLAHFLPIYLIGVALYSRRASLDRIFTAWPALLPLALFNFSKIEALDDRHVAQFAQILSALAMTGIVVAMFRLYVPAHWSKKWMANFSFSLYLLHQPLLCILRLPIMDAINSTYARYVILVSVTIGICTALHLVIQRSPILSFLFNGETKALKDIGATSIGLEPSQLKRAIS